MELNWVFPTSEKIIAYFAIMSFCVSGAAFFSNKMKTRNKIIVVALSIIFLLSLPVVRRWEIRDYIVNDGYTLIVDQSGFFDFLSRHYAEAELQEYLWKPFLYGYRLEHENKLLVMHWDKGDYLPNTLKEIDFME